MSAAGGGGGHTTTPTRHKNPLVNEDCRHSCVVGQMSRFGAAVRSSDGEGEFGEGLRDPMPQVDINAEFVMSLFRHCPTT